MRKMSDLQLVAEKIIFLKANIRIKASYLQNAIK